MLEVNNKSVYESIQDSRKEIVNDILELLESGKPLNWRNDWNIHALRPQNPVSGVIYIGRNRLRLMCASFKYKYKDPRWCSLEQANSQGWKVKSPDRGVICESAITETAVKCIDDNGNIIYKNEKLEKASIAYVALYNAAEIEGIPELDVLPFDKDTSLDIAKYFIDSSECLVTEVALDQPYYSQKHDRIFVPPKEFFKDEESFFAAVAHEMGHSTGHESRLNRDMSGNHGSESYAKEELVAELCALFTQSNLNIELKGDQFENHVGYIKEWINVLKNDPNELFDAAVKASKAADYLYERYLDYTAKRIKSMCLGNNTVDMNKPAQPQDEITSTADAESTHTNAVTGKKYKVGSLNFNKLNKVSTEKGFLTNQWVSLEQAIQLGREIIPNSLGVYIIKPIFDKHRHRVGITNEAVYNLTQTQNITFKHKQPPNQKHQLQLSPSLAKIDCPQRHKKFAVNVIPHRELTEHSRNLRLEDIKRVQPEVNKFIENAVDKEADKQAANTPHMNDVFKENSQDKAIEKSKVNKLRKDFER